MESLMTYGWAILAVMVIGLLLWSLGIFQSDSAPSYKNFPMIKPMMSGTSLTSDGKFVGTFINGVGTTIIITNLTVRNHIDNTTCTLLTPLPILLDSGELFKVEGENCNGKVHE
ncbi:MAG: hypothetical protein NTU61_06435, partial [Candidatus Altiarchaeota archaeon]|nr:hypothetical protein [Candidatus Altiarchaeota archaeon]